jgi:hypothetical protein
MRKFIGFADDKRLEGIARIELVVTALEVQLGLFGGGNRGSYLQRFFLGADILNLGIRSTHLVEDGLDDFAVGAGKNLAEDRTGNLDEKSVALVTVQARGLEPGGVGIDADTGFDKFKELVPNIESFAFPANLRSSRHCRHEKTKNSVFPQMCKSCGKYLLP